MYYDNVTRSLSQSRTLTTQSRHTYLFYNDNEMFPHLSRKIPLFECKNAVINKTAFKMMNSSFPQSRQSPLREQKATTQNRKPPLRAVVYVLEQKSTCQSRQVRLRTDSHLLEQTATSQSRQPPLRNRQSPLRADRQFLEQSATSYDRKPLLRAVSHLLEQTAILQSRHPPLSIEIHLLEQTSTS